VPARKSTAQKALRPIAVPSAQTRAQSRKQALWNAATESSESKEIKTHQNSIYDVPLKGAYSNYQAKKQRNFLPADFHPTGTHEYKARQQVLWNAATDGGSESRYFPQHVKPVMGVPLLGKYSDYHANQQQSYLPADFRPVTHKARTQILWDAAENDDSLASTRKQLGMSSSVVHSKAHGDESGLPRNYLVGMEYHAPNYLAGQGW